MNTLTRELANRYLARALAKAEELGIPVTVAVTDAGGYLIALERMDGAGFLTPQIALGKAYAAAAWQLPGIALKERFRDRPEFVAGVTAMVGQIVFSAGGLPLFWNGVPLGAIGVSGGTPEQDQLCAEEAAALQPNSAV